MKVWNYVVIMMGLIVGSFVLGIAPTGSSEVFNTTGVMTNGTVGGIGTFTGSSFTLSDFWDFLFDSVALAGILVGLALAGLVVSFSGGRYQVENFIILPFITTILIKFIQVFTGMMGDAIASGQSWFIAVMVMLLTPLMVGFVVALVEFFRGTD